jgi:hypothetical protein
LRELLKDEDSEDVVVFDGYRIRSRVEGDKCIVPENHRDGERASNFVGSDQKTNQREVATGFSISGDQHFGK